MEKSKKEAMVRYPPIFFDSELNFREFEIIALMNNVRDRERDAFVAGAEYMSNELKYKNDET